MLSSTHHTHSMFIYNFISYSFPGGEKLMPASRRDLIHLNPETMHICGLHIGRPVVLTSACNPAAAPTIATAWPVSNFPASSAGKVVCSSLFLSMMQICLEQ